MRQGARDALRSAHTAALEGNQALLMRPLLQKHGAQTTYWKRVWDRPHVEMSAVRERVMAECQNHGPLPPLVNEWSAVTADEFAACASRLKGKAGGLDGWSGDEICSLPPGAFDLFARFCACCESSGRLPTAW